MTTPTLTAKLSQLTPLMRECYNYGLDHKGELIRYPGGLWSRRGRIEGDKCFTGYTVKELLSRGFTSESDWKMKDGQRLCSGVRMREAK